MRRLITCVGVTLLAWSYFAVPTLARRAITVNAETVNDVTTTDGVSFTSTDTWSFDNTEIGLCFAGSTDGTSAVDVTPTLTQTGYTWTRIAGPQGFDTAGTPLGGITIFRAIGTSATAAALTATWGADSQTGMTINCWEIGGAETSGVNGANAIRQFNEGSVDANTTHAITFDSSTLSTGVIFFMAGCSTTATWTADSSPAGYAVGTELEIATPQSDWKTQYIVTTADDTPTWTHGANENCGGYVIEIAVDAPDASTNCTRSLLGVGCLFERPE